MTGLRGSGFSVIRLESDEHLPFPRVFYNVRQDIVNHELEKILQLVPVERTGMIWLEENHLQHQDSLLYAR